MIVSRIVVRLFLVLGGLCAANSGQLSTPAYALNVDVLSCNGSIVHFDELSVSFGTDTASGTTLEWGTLAECGASGNFTGGAGNAMCVRSGIGVPNFDARLNTNDFNLLGATSAVLRFNLNYQDFVAGGDLLDVDVSTNSGSSWTNVKQYDFDVPVSGGFQVVGSGVGVAVPLNAYLGENQIRVRFRYYDSGAAPDSGRYVQIDDLSLDCTGGADMRASVGISAPTVIEGQNITYTLGFHNDGPKPATSVAGFGTIPPAFSVLGTTISQGSLGGGGILNAPISADVGSLPVGGVATIAVSAKAGMYPEVVFEILSPPSVAGIYTGYGATFGPPVEPSVPLVGGVILADDGTGNTADACEPILNGSEISGRIAYVVAEGPCKNDERVKRAQDAGAIGVIVGGESAVAPYPIPLSDLYRAFATKLKVMEPSGNVGTPITIPSIMVSREDGDIVKNNIVNSIQVKVVGVDVVAQEQKVTALTYAGEFDPDFTSSFYSFFFASGYNNIAASSVTVLKDSDKDGVADINDSCRRDPNKVGGGICGCGITETDSNANGITDCLTQDELRVAVVSAMKLLKQVKLVLSSGNVKKDKARRKAQKKFREAFKTELTRLVDLATNPILPVLTATANVDLEVLSREAEKQGILAARTKGNSFAKIKRRAGKALRKLSAEIGA